MANSRYRMPDRTSVTVRLPRACTFHIARRTAPVVVATPVAAVTLSMIADVLIHTVIAPSPASTSMTACSNLRSDTVQDGHLQQPCWFGRDSRCSAGRQSRCHPLLHEQQSHGLAPEAQPRQAQARLARTTFTLSLPRGHTWLDVRNSDFRVELLALRLHSATEAEAALAFLATPSSGLWNWCPALSSRGTSSGKDSQVPFETQLFRTSPMIC
mmetsp:Transcript_28558/g.80530  ORF Transcript_28558/g.80530 Transcript_28558/m.80530 type:complete len:213 (+) Transcript_28558:1375-2013(+)